MSLAGKISAENILIGSLGNLRITDEALQEIVNYITAQLIDNENTRQETFETNEANRQAEFKSGEAARETSCQDIPLTDDMLKDGCYTQDHSGFNATTLYGFKTYEREVKEGERYYVHGYTLSVICIYTLFNNNGKHSWFPTQNVGGIETAPIEQSAIVEIPKGVTKLAYSFIGSHPHTIKKLPILDVGIVENIAEKAAESKTTEVVEDVAKETANSVFNEQKSNVNVFRNKNNLINYLNNVLFIGDSLTVGAYYNGTAYVTTSKNYPYFFSRIAHTTPTIKAVGGYTPKQWYDDFANEVNYADYDSAVVWLGTNGGLTDTLTEGSSAETNTCYYCRIVEKMIAENPNIVIFLGNVFSTAPWSREMIETTNNVINKIAEKYSSNVVGVVDNNDGTLCDSVNDELYHPFITNSGRDKVHFGIVGNLHLAEHWVEGICNLLADERVYEKL